MSEHPTPEGNVIHIHSVPWQTDAQSIVAAAMGPPPWIVRKRRIEDEEDRIRTRAQERWRGLAFSATGPEDFAKSWEEEVKLISLGRVNQLIQSHNKYYVAEANLPSDPATRKILDVNGEPYQPWPEWSEDRLLREFPPDYTLAQAARGQET